MEEKLYFFLRMNKKIIIFLELCVYKAFFLFVFFFRSFTVYTK